MLHFLCALQIYFYFYSLLRAGVVSSFRARRGLPPVKAGSAEARSEDIGVAASLVVAAVAGAINMVATSPAQVRGWGCCRPGLPSLSMVVQAADQLCVMFPEGLGKHFRLRCTQHQLHTNQQITMFCCNAPVQQSPALLGGTLSQYSIKYNQKVLPGWQRAIGNVMSAEADAVARSICCALQRFMHVQLLKRTPCCNLACRRSSPLRCKLAPT
jgi:hypothetical protein